MELLRAALTEQQLALDAETRDAYAHDDAEWADFAPPLAVASAETIDDVVAVVRACAATGTPLVPRGAGTGLSGGANAVADSVALTLERMTRILEIDAAERFAVAEAGVLNDALRAAVDEHGLWYPPDPASSAISTIGGNVATNAGGLCCVKYGVTADAVIALTVVLADGSITRVGRRTAKGSTGYQLAQLLVGSEGTLGIVVDATVKLRPLAGREDRAIVGAFGSLHAAGEAVAAISADGIIPAALELIDHTCLEAVAAWQSRDLPVLRSAAALLLVRVDEPGTLGRRLQERVAEHFLAADALGVESSVQPEDADRLFLARRLAYPSLERLGQVLTEDVCVPRRAVPKMLARIEAIALGHDVTISNIAHAGDGNLHPLIIAPEGDDEARGRAKEAFDRIVEACRDLGGTVTGEHGVGLLKLPGAAAELSPEVLAMHRAIKDALDPQGILNPGKAFPG